MIQKYSTTLTPIYSYTYHRRAVLCDW